MTVSSSIIERLPPDCFSKVMEHLKGKEPPYPFSDEKTILTTGKVSHSWKKHALLEKERKEAKKRIFIHPQEIRKLFTYCGINLRALPLIEIGENPGTSYIREMGVEEMPSSIARLSFKERGWTRPGLAFCLKGRSDGTYRFGRHRIPIRDIQGVMVIYQLYPGDNLEWSVAFGRGPIQTALFDLHFAQHLARGEHQAPFVNEGDWLRCDECPKGMRKKERIDYETLFNLLAGKDPFFKIGGGYVSPGPLPLPPFLAPRDSVAIPILESAIASEEASHRKALGSIILICFLILVFGAIFTAIHNQ